MEKKKTRVSVDLSDTAVKVLRLAAKADGRLLKNYLENKLNDLVKVVKPRVDKNESF